MKELFIQKDIASITIAVEMFSCFLSHGPDLEKYFE